ncbi:MAG: SNF2-related protein [Acidobacteriota bacterium]
MRASKKERRRIKRKDRGKVLRIHKDRSRRALAKSLQDMFESDLAEDMRDYLDEAKLAENWQEAAEAATRLVDIEPLEPEHHIERIECLACSGAATDELLVAARGGLEACPDEPELYAVVINVLAAYGLVNKAEQTMDEAMDRFGASFFSLMRKAPVAGGRGREILGWRKTLFGVKKMQEAGTLAGEGLDPAIEPALDPDEAQVEIEIGAGGRKRPEPEQPQAEKARREEGDRQEPPRGPLLPPMPLPGTDAGSTPLAFVDQGRPEILDRLAAGRDDGMGGVRLAARAVEVLAEDGFDRLLCLDGLKGVDRLGFQVETVLKVLRRFRGRVLLSDEVGLGKTIEACMVIKEYMARGLVRRCLILAPPALVAQWKAELDEKFGIEAAATSGPDLRRDPDAFWSGDGVIVASLATARKKEHRDRILAQHFDMLVVDEAHRIKNRATEGWKLANGVRSRFFILVTATPVETYLGELYNVVTLLRPGTLGAEADFRSRFVRRKDPSRPRDPEKLRKLLSEVMIRNTRAACGLVLPPRTAATVIVRPSDAEARLYAMLVGMARRAAGRSVNLVRLLMEEAGSSPAAVAATASAVLEGSGGPGSGEDLAQDLRQVAAAAREIKTTSKLDALSTILPGDRLLLFSRFRATLDEIARYLEARGVRFAPFHGGMSAAERQRAVAAFAGRCVHVLLCSGIGGEGQNFQFCHRLVNFDLPWNPMQIEQRIGRIHRIGQTERVEVVSLACAGTAEENILKVLDERINLFELVVGEMDMLLGEMIEEKEFEQRVFDIYARSRDEEGIEQGFDRLAGELLDARQRLDRAQALDEELFGEDFGT